MSRDDNRTIFSYAETRDLMMVCYPRLFLDEADVLHHLFFVLGNGYEWQEGALTAGQTVDAYIDQAVRSKSPNTSYETGDLLRDQAKERHYRRICADEFPDNSYQHGPCASIRRKIYPLCDLAEIANVPTDVKNDWLIAAWRAVLWAESPQAITTDSDRQQLTNARERITWLADQRNLQLPTEFEP